MLKEEQLSYVIRGCVYEVFRHLGGGFLEKVYENALLKELHAQGLRAVPKRRSKCAIRRQSLVNILLMLLSRIV